MKTKPAQIGLFVVLAVCYPISASISEERRVDADAEGMVEIGNTAGSVSIKGWDRKEVEVKGTIGDGVKELVVERTGNTVLVDVKLPDKNCRRNQCDAHL